MEAAKEYIGRRWIDCRSRLLLAKESIRWRSPFKEIQCTKSWSRI